MNAPTERIIANARRAAAELSPGFELTSILTEAADRLEELSKWRGMESAPKDGTLVLLASTNNAEFPMRCRRWDAEKGRWRGDDGWDATLWLPLPPIHLKVCDQFSVDGEFRTPGVLPRTEPAPVRVPGICGGALHAEWAAGWNACRAEVLRLNANEQAQEAKS